VQVGDITTVSKSGTNNFHGDLFWYTQNRALNSTAYGQNTKPQLVANDFGVSAGGPVLIPHLYNGHDKTFFFGTYEGFRYPRGQTIQQELNTDRGNSTSKNDTWQFIENVTWNKGRHTMKFDFDYRKIRAVSALGFLSGDNYGYYNFDGTFTGAPFADFLLGLPINMAVDNVKNDNDGRSNHYNVYAQDSFRVNERLTLEYGLRFEFHPGYIDATGIIGNFETSPPKSGAVTYPDGAQATLAPESLQSFNSSPHLVSPAGPTINGSSCTSVLSASQAHVPNYLPDAPKRFVPRFGFAYRPFGDKTVFRGGFGVFNTEVLGSIYYALTGTLQSNTRTYNNINSQGKPIFQWPQMASAAFTAVSVVFET